MKLGMRLFVLLVLIGTFPDAVAHGDEATSRSVSAQPQPDRRQFAEELARVRDGEKQEVVRRLLGSPEDIRRTADDNSLLPCEEVWCYGTDGHGSLATLGEVWLRNGAVLWVRGGSIEPPCLCLAKHDGLPIETAWLPSSSVISENELRADMRFLHDGSERLADCFSRWNDPLHLIRVTNYLQPLGKEKALAIIGEYSRIHNHQVDDTWLFLLLHTLFDVPQPLGHMPRIAIGATDPAPPKDPTRIPRFPIRITTGTITPFWRQAQAGMKDSRCMFVETARTVRSGTWRKFTIEKEKPTTNRRKVRLRRITFGDGLFVPLAEPRM